MRAIALLVVGLLVVSAFAFLIAAPPTRAATINLSDQLTESAGSTTAFGGGDYRFIEFKSDAAFGIVWGNATHANNIYVVAIKARYLGVGQVHDANGTLLFANQPIKVFTIYAAQLQNLTEYRDSVNDGIANYSRTYNATTRTWSNYAFSGDVGYKFVNLSTNWVPSQVRRTTGPTYRTWTFSLNAMNLAYYNITNKKKLPGTPPIVNYTFHLNASLVQDTDVSVPQWNVTVTRSLGRDVLSSVVPMSGLVLASIKTVHYEVKWDQFIQGWTYDNRNNQQNLRRLMLEVGSIVVNYVPPGVAAGWRLIHQLGDDGRATYNTTAGLQTAGNTTGVYLAPQVFKSPNLDFGGDWTRIARFLWTTNSTVDGAVRPLLGEIVGGWGFVYADARGVWYGFVLLTALNYLGGTTIVHDPTITSDVTTDLQFQSSTTNPPSTPGSPANFGAVIIGIIVVVVLVFVAYAMIVRGRKGQQPPVQPPMEPPTQPPPP